MRALCHLAAAALLLVSAAAFADSTPADFKAHVLDPPSLSGANSITSTPYTFSFNPCTQGELPGGNTADGCFLGVNHTGSSFTGLELAFLNTAALNSQPSDCSLAPNHNVYTQASCVLDTSVGPNGTYFLDFSNGIIGNGESFYITEQGVDPLLFPTGTLTATTATPEPSSLLLLLSGLPTAGVLARRARAGRCLFRARGPVHADGN